MSVTTQASTPQHAGEHSPADARCLQCATALAAGQEWCLECGAARTLVHRPPDWRVPVAVIGTVVALALAAFLIVLINLSENASHSTATIASTSASTPASAPASSAGAAATTTPTPTASSSTQMASWPIGLGGWTVVLASSSREASARATARRIAATGIPVGTLNSTEHPALVPGYWVVFSGRFASGADARAQARALITKGYTGAHARLVGRQGV